MSGPLNSEQSRTLGFVLSQRDEENEQPESRTMRLSFSSDAPVDMGWGVESLSHVNGAMRVGERQTSMPLLFNHNRDDVIGVVESISIEGSKGYADVRFARNARGQEIFDMVRDGVLRNVSFQYRVFKYEEDVEREMFTALDWEPFEISIVTVPADPNVGVGRALSVEKGADLSAVDGKAVVSNESSDMENIENVRMDAVQQERSRINEISAMCAEHAIDDNKRNQMIADGVSIAEARSAVLDILKARGSVKPVADMKPDFSNRDLQGYSLVRAIHAQMTGDWSKAGKERELSAECARKLGRESVGGFFMPTAIRAASDYTVGTAAKGGNLVATDLMAGDFIDMLRNNAVVMQLGAKVISGLVGNVAIPRQSGAASTYWVTEDGDVTASSGAFDQVSLTPKTIGALSTMSRQLLQQSTPDIEMLVRNDLAKQIALGIDLAAIQGSGASGQPKGIINQTGIGSVTINTSVTYDDLIDLETAVATANADVAGMAYIANAAMIGEMKKLTDLQGLPIWYQQPGAVAGTPGQVNGYAVRRTNQCPANTIIFGNFSDLIIGEWGSLEILPNVYGSGYKNGAVEIRALQTVDIALRHAASFAVAS